MITASVSRVLLSRHGVVKPTVILVLDGKAFVLTPEESAAIRVQLQEAEDFLAAEMAGPAELAALAVAGAA